MVCSGFVPVYSGLRSETRFCGVARCAVGRPYVRVRMGLSEEQKEEMLRIQREKLEKRRSGKALEGVEERRQEIQAAIDAKIKPEGDEDPIVAWRKQRELDGNPELKYDDEPEGSVPFPMASFGIPKYDQGERFDLRLPYVDKGYVDESYEDPMQKFGNWFKKLVGKGKDESEEQQSNEKEA